MVTSIWVHRLSINFDLIDVYMIHVQVYTVALKRNTSKKEAKSVK